MYYMIVVYFFERLIFIQLNIKIDIDKSITISVIGTVVS